MHFFYLTNENWLVRSQGSLQTTLVHNHSIFMGFQWALHKATVVLAGGHNGGPCKQKPKTDYFHLHEHHIYHVGM